MPTAETLIKEIYLLPLKEREKIAHHLIHYGIRATAAEKPEVLDLLAWQDEISQKPFNLKQAAEYLGVSVVTLRRWIKTGHIPAYKAGRAYTFDVLGLKQFKKDHLTSGSH